MATFLRIPLGPQIFKLFVLHEEFFCFSLVLQFASCFLNLSIMINFKDDVFEIFLLQLSKGVDFLKVRK
jgi:hypothetical protein